MPYYSGDSNKKDPNLESCLKDDERVNTGSMRAAKVPLGLSRRVSHGFRGGKGSEKKSAIEYVNLGQW